MQIGEEFPITIIYENVVACLILMLKELLYEEKIIFGKGQLFQGAKK